MEASERRREAESISRLSTALAQAGSGREAANRLFDELESVLEVTRMMIATVDEEAGVAAGFAARGIDEAWWQTVVLDLETARSAVVAVARERSSLVVFDVKTSPQVNQELAARVGAHSAAFVPLLADGRVTAVLAVASEKPRLFTPSETELMQDLANETALALGHASSRDALQAALARERLVGEISRRVRSELDLDAVLSVAVEEVGMALDVSRAFIRLGEPDRRGARSAPNGTRPGSRPSATPPAACPSPTSPRASGGRWRSPTSSPRRSSTTRASAGGRRWSSSGRAP